MNINLDKIFPIPVWWADLDIDNKELYDWCKELQKYDPKGANKSNHGGWQSNSIFLEKYFNVKPVQDLFFAIMNMTNQAIVDYNFNLNHKFVRIANAWININDNKDAHNKSHSHPNATFSGVYYVKCNENSGTINFQRNFYESFLIKSYGEINDPSELSAEGASYPPLEGRLLLFPSHLVHFVSNNLDDSERVSISFNVVYSGWEMPNVEV